MKDDLKILVLGALLHDIGKFAQRAGRPCTRNLEAEYLPSFNGKRSHWHALYSDYFIEKDLPLPHDLERVRSKLARVASVHHRPDTNNISEMCIMIADRLSAGSDRFENTDIETQGGFRASRLVSVFDEVELVNHVFKAPGEHFYELTALDANNRSAFPKKGEPKGDTGEYIPYFESFLSDLKTLRLNDGFCFYLQSLVSVLEKYTWAIPSSSYKTLADVSLFDHSFSTASIAQALFVYQQSIGKTLQWNDSEIKFRLLIGDLSGIQKYIFGISKNSGRGVSKIFRARSFFLQTLTRSIVLEIEKRTGLCSVCRLMDSGGKFVLLLPNTAEITNELGKLNEDVQFWFRQKFKGLLSMPLSWSTGLKQEDFQLNQFQNKLDEVDEALGQAKLQGLHTTFAKNGPVVVADYDEHEGGNCSLCEIYSADDKSSARYKDKEGVAIPVCQDCCDQIVYIGTRLPKTNYLIYGKEGKIPLFGDFKLTLSKEPPANVTNAHYVESLTNDISFSRCRIARHLPRITRDELSNEKWFKLFEQEDGFYEMIHEFDDKPEAFIPKTFGMIAQRSKKELKNGDLTGRPLLGFLKADVDNLGLIFSMGLGEKLSVSRLASLSRMVNFFFSAYIVELLEKKFPNIYVVFAGGDDLFLIGPWSQAVEFALTLRKELGEFCANNEDITLSCGILVGKPRLPMRKAADIVKEHLGSAKSFEAEDGVNGKNTVLFLGEVLSWEKLESMIDLGNLFDKALEEKERTNFTSGFLYRLLTYHKMYRRFYCGMDLKSGKYLSQAHYDIARNIRLNKYDNDDEVDMLYRIFAVGSKDRSELDMLHIPLFYAMNLNRDLK